jgi:hypothetical protein
MRQAYLLLVFSLITIVSAGVFLSKPSVPAKLPPVVLPSAKPPEEAEIKAATPEEPGPIGTVVSPLTVLTKTSADRQAPPPAPQGTSAADHADATRLPAPNHFLHKQFTLTDRSDFAFSVPPHIVNPSLRGNFHAYAKDSPDSTNRKPANIDLALMNEREFEDFVQGRSADATYELDSSSSRTLNYAIPPTLDQPQRYHLVFLGSRRSSATVVDADFTVTFQ